MARMLRNSLLIRGVMKCYKYCVWMVQHRSASRRPTWTEHICCSPFNKAMLHKRAEALSKTAGKFALSMVDLFFTRSTLTSSLAIRKEEKERLDPDILCACASR